MTEAKIGVMLLQVKECQGLPITPETKRKGTKQILSKNLQREHNPAEHNLDLRLLASRTVKE